MMFGSPSSVPRMVVASITVWSESKANGLEDSSESS